MIFATFWFVLFGLIFIPVFWLLRRPALRLPFLVIACATFHYHFAGPAGVLPIIAIGTVTYFCGLARSSAACVGGIILSVAALCFYKYTHFLTVELLGLFRPAWGAASETFAQKFLPAAPPLGMSFFAFEFVHYLYDVKRGAAPIRHPLRFISFAIFFPTLVAGPIKRFEQFQPSLQRGLERITLDDVAVGLRRVALGFFKKVVIADNLTLAINFYAPQADTLNHFGQLTQFQRWFVLGMLGTRILMDFSGYSDIAIGLARMIGIVVPENFNWPYAAASVREFWQRWHISLSSWIRDYVYIPLGGSRHGLLRKMGNGLFAFALCGLWHGPSWNFVAWGVYHGLGLAVSSNYAALPGVGPRLQKLCAAHPLPCWALTQLYVWIGWLLFFYPIGSAAAMAGLLFTPATTP
jgi:alginate O-acetyltransferase complex protein AlgI